MVQVSASCRCNRRGLNFLGFCFLDACLYHGDTMSAQAQALLRDLLNPEALGHAVSSEVRIRAAVALSGVGCTWTEGDSRPFGFPVLWSAGCGFEVPFALSSLSLHGFKFCPGCGLPIQEKGHA